MEVRDSASDQLTFGGGAFFVTNDLFVRKEALDAARTIERKRLAQFRECESKRIGRMWNAFKALQPDLCFDAWEFEEYAGLHRYVLQESLAELSARNVNEVRSVLDWMFPSEFKVMIGGNGVAFRVPVRLVPFNFWLCCYAQGADHEDIREGALIMGIRDQKQLIAESVENGNQPSRARVRIIQILQNYLKVARGEQTLVQMIAETRRYRTLGKSGKKLYRDSLCVFRRKTKH